MKNSNKRRVHRRRPKARGRNVLLVMFSLLFIVSISAMAFTAVLFFNNMLPINEPVPVLASNPNEIPGWIGPLDTNPQPSYELPANVETSDPYEYISHSIFSVFPFYQPNMSPYYYNFHAAHPYLDIETVVWKVNAMLHLPFYSYVRFNNDPTPLLVNPSHRLPYGFSPPILVPVYEGNPQVLATPETAAAFQRLRSGAISAGLDLAVVSGYRPATRQRYLFERQGSVDGVVARPYQSEHQTGRALDLWGPGPSGLLDAGGGPPSPTGQWVADNAHNYGFIVRYTYYNTHITGFIPEPWHITYVTVPIAEYIYNNRLSSLEEFVARYPDWGLT